MSLTIEKFVSYVKKRVEKLGVMLGPEEDWRPAIFTVGRFGNKLHYIEDFFRDELGKEMLANVGIPRILKEDQAELAAFLSTSWLAKLDAPEGASSADEAFGSAEFEKFREQYGGQISKFPGRKEAVTIVVVTADSNVVLCGYIKRQESRPPVIEKWDFIESEGLEVGGRFGEALHRGLMSVAARYN